MPQRPPATAQPAWAALSATDRWAHLERFKAAISAKADQLADAIVIETGKLRSEAKAEIQTLINRFELVKSAMAADLKPGSVGPGETLRYQALGVVGVIGPFNFPLHLCHAHVIPALAAGNTVVVKPSDITPLCGQRYAECAARGGAPGGRGQRRRGDRRCRRGDDRERSISTACASPAAGRSVRRSSRRRRIDRSC